MGPPWRLRQQDIHLQCRGPRFNPWVRKILWRREWLPTPVFLPGEFHGQRNLAGYSPMGRKELDTTEWFSSSSSMKAWEEIKVTWNPTTQKWSVFTFWCTYFFVIIVTKLEVHWRCYFVSCSSSFFCYEHFLSVTGLFIYFLAMCYFMGDYFNVQTKG